MAKEMCFFVSCTEDISTTQTGQYIFMTAKCGEMNSKEPWPHLPNCESKCSPELLAKENTSGETLHGRTSRPGGKKMLVLQWSDSIYMIPSEDWKRMRKREAMKWGERGGKPWSGEKDGWKRTEEERQRETKRDTERRSRWRDRKRERVKERGRKIEKATWCESHTEDRQMEMQTDGETGIQQYRQNNRKTAVQTKQQEDTGTDKTTSKTATNQTEE